jgi:hypothetical protein
MRCFSNTPSDADLFPQRLLRILQLIALFFGNYRLSHETLAVSGEGFNKKYYSGFRNMKKPVIPRAASTLRGNDADFGEGVTGRRAADTVLVAPALTRAFVE